MKTVIFHNSRCSKSRAALKLLAGHGVEPQVVEYLREPPAKAELARIVRMLGVKPAQIVRFKEDAAKALGLSATDERSDDEWLTLLVENPALIERPIVVRGKRAALGRPPEAVLALLDD